MKRSVRYICNIMEGGSTLLNINNSTGHPSVFGTSFTVCVYCGSQGAKRERDERESSTWWDLYMLISCSTSTTKPLSCFQVLFSDDLKQQPVAFTEKYTDKSTLM